MRGPYTSGNGIVVDQRSGYHGDANGNPYDPNSVNNRYDAGNTYNGNQYRLLGAEGHARP